ncbi:MAG TPA: helix-turn-helix domain-containing protein [Oscillospiraceae bacterium]|nr:helix-turn-helix domain-containing protein [Oscillospiraceae bacterium]
MESETRRPVQKRKKGIETTGRILEVSADLFARKGYDAVSLHEIAAAAGIRESSVYNHFEGKSGILDALLALFREKAPASRPSEADLDKMLLIMQPEEIFRNILFYFGSHGDKTVENAAMVITNEKYKNALAAETYYRSVVREPGDYYERLIQKMAARGMIRQVDARLFAEEYNYVCIALTKEYFMAENGLADLHAVVRYMAKTIDFFCGLMKEGAGERGREAET